MHYDARFCNNYYILVANIQFLSILCNLSSNIFTHHNTRSTLRRIEIIAIKIIIINIS